MIKQIFEELNKILLTRYGFVYRCQAENKDRYIYAEALGEIYAYEKIRSMIVSMAGNLYDK